MINVQEACRLYCRKYPDRQVDTVLDVGDEWVISGKDARTGLEIDESPIAVSKADGAIRVFFPPANRKKLRNAVVVPLD